MPDSGNKNFDFQQPIVLLGGGAVKAELVSRYAEFGWPVVCADGGADNSQNAGVVPDLIIGDMDSISNRCYWQSRTKVLELPEQDTTDFEKCLYSVSAPLYLACGFTGSRFDHTLASLHTLYKYVATHSVVMTAGSDICFACDGDLHIELCKDLRFSIYPLTRTRFIQSSGLAYPLDGLMLEQGGMIGTSNITTESRVEITLDHGAYVVILPASSLESVLRCLQTDR